MAFFKKKMISVSESQAPSRSRTAVPNAANLVEKISLEDDNDISASVYMLNEMDDSVSQNSASQDVLESSDGDDDDDDNVDREGSVVKWNFHNTLISPDLFFKFK